MFALNSALKYPGEQRTLLPIILAKLEAVESGITTLESQFLANVVLPDGGTVDAPQVDEA